MTQLGLWVYDAGVMKRNAHLLATLALIAAPLLSAMPADVREAREEQNIVLASPFAEGFGVVVLKRISIKRETPNEKMPVARYWVTAADEYPLAAPLPLMLDAEGQKQLEAAFETAGEESISLRAVVAADVMVGGRLADPEALIQAPVEQARGWAARAVIRLFRVVAEQ